MKKTTAVLLDLLYPRRCALCDRLLTRKERSVCGVCRAGLDVRIHRFPGGFAPLPYRGGVRRSVLRMKYGGRPEYARFYAAMIFLAGRKLLERYAPQAVIPVPIHRRRLAKRGYNQAEEIAKLLARALGVPLLSGAVVRVRHTRPQRGLGRRERGRNLQGAFACVPGAALPARVLVVDDIFTSGATVREMTRALRAAGVREVFAACAALA